VLAADGGVDRNGAGAAGVRDAALARLNAAVHPLVRTAVEEWVSGLGRGDEPPAVAVVEAALLVESEGHDAYDLLFVVWCPARQQLERALARGMAEERARAVLAAQPIDAAGCGRRRHRRSSGSPRLAAEVDRAWGGSSTRAPSRRPRSPGQP
jgi:dephospho-CoA kinase